MSHPAISPLRLKLVLLLAPLLCQMSLAATANAAKTVKVFVLTGQSNMEGKAKVSLLERQIVAPETKELFAHLHEEGKFIERDDVDIKFLDRHGKLTVGFGSRNCVGPELEFGNVVGNHYDEPVLIIKTAWGGKSLFRDFRPPSAGLPDEERLAADLAGLQKRDPKATQESVVESYGHYYREMIREVQQTLAHKDELFPQLAGYEPELAGAVWFQGWNDMISPEYTAAYAENMAHFIRDLRKDLHAPHLPFVIGQLGVGGVTEGDDSKKNTFKEAQAAAAELPEFAGNVAVVKTDQYWDQEAQAVFDKGWKKHLEEWNRVGSDFPYHYLGSHKCYGRIGRAFGEAMLALQK